MRLDCVLSITASPVYCLDFGSGDVRSAPARRAPEIPERIERTPGISSAVAAGAEITDPLHETDYGSRDFAARDPEGNRWNFGTYRGEPRR